MIMVSIIVINNKECGKKYSELALTTSRFLKKINLGFPHVECFFSVFFFFELR